MSEKSIIPKLTNGFSIIFAELQTGIVLTTGGRRYLGTGDYYLVFDSVDQAMSFAHEKVTARPEIECAIYDKHGELIKVIKHV